MKYQGKDGYPSLRGRERKRKGPPSFNPFSNCFSYFRYGAGPRKHRKQLSTRNRMAFRVILNALYSSDLCIQNDPTYEMTINHGALHLWSLSVRGSTGKCTAQHCPG